MSTSAIELHSLGHLCALLQRDPRAIRRAAEALDIEPAMRLDNVPHYSADQVALLTDHFRDIRGTK